MNSNPLVVGTYRRYKASTRKLVQWLVQTAEEISGTHTATAKPANKSNARGRQLVPVDRLVPLTKVIIAADPRVDIELGILEVARDSVQGRKECALWYESLSKRKCDGGETAEANRKHQYMLGKLEEVYELLRREVKARRPKRKKKIELASDGGDLSNIYQYLELEETASTHDSVPTGRQPTRRSRKTEGTAPSRKTQYELEAIDGEEKLFALYCLFRDLRQLRTRTSGTWKQYQDGEISFVTACHTTEAAMQIAFVFAEELEKVYPDLALFDNIIDLLGEDNYVRAARGATMSAAEGGEDSSAHRYTDKQDADLLLMPAWAIAHDVQCLARLLLGEMGDISDRRLATVFALHPFGQALIDVVGDLAEISGVSINAQRSPAINNRRLDDLLYHGDHFTTELCKLILGQKTLGIGIVAAIAMYTDVYDTLNGDLDRGLRECTPILQEMTTSAHAFRDWYRNSSHLVRASVMPKNGELDVDYFCDVATQLAPDVEVAGSDRWTLRVPDFDKAPPPSLTKGIKDRIRRGGAASLTAEEHEFLEGILHAKFRSSSVPANVLATFPVLMGHATWKIMYQLQTDGMTSCNLYLNTLAAAHLHTAAMAQGSCVEDWPDMNAIIQREGKKNSLLRHGDGSVHGAAKQYCFALGMSLSQVPRTEKPRLPSKTFRRRNTAQFTRGSYLRAHDDAEDLTGMGGVLLFQRAFDMRKLHQAVAFFATEGPGLTDPSIAKQWQQTKKLSPDQILQVMQDIAVQDEKCMMIDYFGIHKRAVELVAHAATLQLTSTQPRAFDMAKLDKELPYEFVYDVIWDAAAIELRDSPPGPSVLHALGLYLNKVLRRDGDAGLGRINKFSLGQQLPSQAPKNLYGPKALCLPARPRRNRLRIIHGPLLSDLAHHLAALSRRLLSGGSDEPSQETFLILKSSLNKELTQANINKEVTHIELNSQGEIAVRIAQAKEDSQSARKKKTMFMRSGIQAWPQDQADLVEAGLVTVHAVTKADGRIVLQLRNVVPQ